MCLLDGLFLHAVLGLPALGNSWEVVKQLYTAIVIAWAVGVLEATQMAERATGQTQEEPATLQQCPRLPVDRETEWLVQERDFFNHHLKQTGDIGKWDQAIKVTFQPAVYCLVFTLTNQTVLKVDITTTTPPHLRQAREVVYATLALVVSESTCWSVIEGGSEKCVYLLYITPEGVHLPWQFAEYLWWRLFLCSIPLHPGWIS